MSKLLVTDELWSLVGPLFPAHEPSPKGGHPRVSDRVCLGGIIFVPRTGIGWEDFPQEMGCCGMTLWNRLHEWQAAGAWRRVHELLLAELRDADQIDFSRVVVDSSSVRAVFGGRRPAPARWTAARRARSTTSSWTPAASRSPARTRARTRTT